MSHEITINVNGQAEAFYTKEKAWHGLGTILENAPSGKEALIAANLNWQVLQSELYDSNQNLIKNYKANLRNDDNSCLGVVTNRYKVFQNDDAFSFLDSLVESGDLKYESAGSLKGGRKVWLLARMNEAYFVSQDDPMLNYMLLLNQHDGYGSCIIMPTSVRVVCWNTLQLALRNQTNVFHVRHTTNMADKLTDAKTALGFIQQNSLTLNNILKDLSISGVVENQVNKFLEEMFPLVLDESVDKERREKIQNKILGIREEVKTIFDSHEYCQTEATKGTAFGLLNAYTQYIDHERSYKAQGDDNRIIRRAEDSMFGIGASKKSEAFDVIRKIAGK